MFADPPTVLAEWKKFRQETVDFFGEQLPEVCIADGNLAAECFLKGDVQKARENLYSALEKLKADAKTYQKQIDIISCSSLVR